MVVPPAERVVRFWRRGLGFAPEQRVLALQGGEGVHGVIAADGAHARLRQAEVADLAGVDEFGDGAGGVLDRDLRVDAVLVEQVDGVDAEPAQRPVDGAADVVGLAGQTGLAALDVDSEAELVVMTTWSRTGARASPTSSC